MRYLGNKTKLVHFIDGVIQKYCTDAEVFADFFAGTCAVSDFVKSKYRIIANDYMAFSAILCKAKLAHVQQPIFTRFKELYRVDPFAWFNAQVFTPNDRYFLYNNYTPVGNRRYFTEENAIKIDGMRLQLEELYAKNVFSENEYHYMLASLLESVTKVSNTSGTYQAYFKFWEQRSLKEFLISPLEICTGPLFCEDNITHNENANTLARKIAGDIAYLDPPYTINQYTNSYHMLETIARYDAPEIFGKTGRRKKRELSLYSNKGRALEEFEDLFRQLQFQHVFVSYSNQSLVPITELTALAKKFAKNGKVRVEKFDYREYATNNLSYKGKEQRLQECVLYFEKDIKIHKSPLNYAGSKNSILPHIEKHLPKHVGTFVDAMGGAFNVGANIVAMREVVYNEYNSYVFSLVKMLLESQREKLLATIEEIIKVFHLEKKDKEAYIALRQEYNKVKSPELLYVLQVYAFQNIIRFNSKQEMNTPVGNNEFCESLINKIKQFFPKTKAFKLVQGRYQELDFQKYPLDTLFYFDPPYFITKAGYNDGKRGLDGWTVEHEKELLYILKNLDTWGYKFMLSNVLRHNGKEHHLLQAWVEEHAFTLISLGKTGIKYPREEVLVTNYTV